MDMPISTAPSPAHAQILRRRKKRLTPTNGAPGSSLSGLNRSSIRVVELVRGSSGYGFTISGQKPCLLRCIVEGSPAEFIGLQPGNCLVGVNGKDVSHLAHDDVVRLIGSCTGLLRLHVADSYFSESSDDESLKGNHPRSRYPHRPKVPSKSSLGSKKQTLSDLAAYDLHDNQLLPQSGRVSSRSTDASCRIMGISSSSRRATWDPLIPTRHGPRPPLPPRDEPQKASAGQSHLKTDRSKGTSSMGSTHGNVRVESVRVFEHLDDDDVDSHNQNQSDSLSSASFPLQIGNLNENFPNNSHNLAIAKKVSASNVAHCSTTKPVDNPSAATFHVVGYVGSVELQQIDEDRRLEALSACVKRLRMEKRVRSVVLLRVQSNGISLFNSSQNVQTGPPLAFYSYNIISFCGACSDDRRFFGLVTCTHPTKKCSCHVFMVEPKLLRHTEHNKRARAFGIHCNSLQVPKTGQVLGLQECAEFPATADPILSAILQLRHGNCSDDANSPQNYGQSSSMRSPSEASNRLETNSSNSDSGIGFRDDCDRLSARIYDIIEPSVLYETKQIKSSPVPRKRYPPSKKHSENNTSGSGSSVIMQPKKSPINIASAVAKISSTDASSNAAVEQVKNDDFECDPNSLNEILRQDQPTEMVKPAVKPRRLLRDVNKDRLSLNTVPQRPPRPIEVSVLVTPPRPKKPSDKQRHNRASMELMTRISPTIATETSTARMSLARIGTRSLDNLCSPEILSEPCNYGLELKGVIGASTPALCQKSVKVERTDEAQFKIPAIPKQKMMVERVEKWAESVEKLLNDATGLEIFTEFLEREFSAENIHFYTSCLQFKNAFNELTQSQRISMCSTIFQRYLQNGATDPINVDFQARSQVEKSLAQPSADMFDSPLAQVYSLLKFDCYPRFLRSELYRDYSSGTTVLPPSEPSDSDHDSNRSHKLNQNSRRRSLLPWNIKNRSKLKSRNKVDSLDQEDDFRRQSRKLVRVILPDNSTTALSSTPGESLCTVVQRLLERREFHYSAFEVVSVDTGKALDLTLDVSELTTREIRVEPRAFIGIELPQGWKVGLRANPCRKVAEVLKTILAQHALKLDSVVVYDIENAELVDLKCPIGKLDGHSLHVKSKSESQLDEITNHIQDFHSYEHIIDDDQMSAKTSSSQTSSVFKEFLRRSSKKYKRAKGKLVPHSSMEEEVRPDDVGSSIRNSNEVANLNESFKVSDEENSNPTPFAGHSTQSHQITSPLSVVPTELNLIENSRNRKPIYISQTESSSR